MASKLSFRGNAIQCRPEDARCCQGHRPKFPFSHDSGSSLRSFPLLPVATQRSTNAWKRRWTEVFKGGIGAACSIRVAAWNRRVQPRNRIAHGLSRRLDTLEACQRFREVPERAENSQQLTRLAVDCSSMVQRKIRFLPPQKRFSVSETLMSSIRIGIDEENTFGSSARFESESTADFSGGMRRVFHIVLAGEALALVRRDDDRIGDPIGRKFARSSGLRLLGPCFLGPCSSGLSPSGLRSSRICREVRQSRHVLQDSRITASILGRCPLPAGVSKSSKAVELSLASRRFVPKSRTVVLASFSVLPRDRFRLWETFLPRKPQSFRLVDVAFSLLNLATSKKTRRNFLSSGFPTTNVHCFRLL